MPSPIRSSAYLNALSTMGSYRLAGSSRTPRWVISSHMTLWRGKARGSLQENRTYSGAGVAGHHPAELLGGVPAQHQGGGHLVAQPVPEPSTVLLAPLLKGGPGQGRIDMWGDEVRQQGGADGPPT